MDGAERDRELALAGVGELLEGGGHRGARVVGRRIGGLDRCEHAVLPAQHGAGQAVVVAVALVLHDPARRPAGQAVAYGGGERGARGGDDLEAELGVGGGPERVGEPGGHGDHRPVLDDDGHLVGERVDRGLGGGGRGCDADAVGLHHGDGAGGLRRPGGAPCEADEAGREGAREPLGLLDAGGGARFGPPERDGGCGRPEQPFGLAGDLYEQRCLDGDEGSAFLVAEPYDGVLAHGLHQLVGASGEQTREHGQRVGHSPGEGDDVLGHVVVRSFVVRGVDVGAVPLVGAVRGTVPGGVIRRCTRSGSGGSTGLCG